MIPALKVPKEPLNYALLRMQRMGITDILYYSCKTVRAYVSSKCASDQILNIMILPLI